ncbi:16S rRNA (cytosine967-C5)-methyltransferase [Mariprofundus micogutta]|uniref:16S rRNA (Cytosine967-C5)-methyltransferase n=2 Tax=Mariprofundus micogutta TaxID=1921010 RepID=A0A1L8CN41_9PROT|nr:16S rRNA (cytosine967-C5)-methyltransferase [Mariprofundus micogutta]
MAVAECEEKDRRLLHELVYGVLRHFFALEADFSRFCKTKPDAIAHCALLLGTYQLRHMRIPTHAAVSETVAAMGRMEPKAKGFVNAVLRRVTENEAPKKLKPHQRVELPKWIYASWRDAFGAEIVQGFSEVLKQPPALCLAVFENRSEWIDQVQKMGIEAEPGTLSPYAVLLPSGTDVASLPGFAEGNFTVMDQAAQAAVMALNVSKQDALIVDICAAPGGKTALLSKRYPQARVIAVELNEKRLPRLSENLERMRCDNVSVIRADAGILPLLSNRVDAVMLDAPCSASGILRRHPDAKFLHDRDEVMKLAAIQLELLSEAKRIVKADAELVYAVCSIHEQENEDVLNNSEVLSKTRLFPSSSHDGFFFATVKADDGQFAIEKGSVQ